MLNNYLSGNVFEEFQKYNIPVNSRIRYILLKREFYDKYLIRKYFDIPVNSRIR